MSIVATLHHSQILIWIRLCHVRGLRKWAFFFYSSLTHFSSLFPCHISMLPPFRPFDVPSLIWSLMESVALLCLSVAGSQIPGFIAARLHSGEWVSRQPWTQQPSKPEEPKWASSVDPKYWSCRVVISVSHMGTFLLWQGGLMAWWTLKKKDHYSNNNNNIHC